MVQLTSNELTLLKDYLLSLGVTSKNLVCAFIEGSSLYVKEPRDLDILCLLNEDPLIHKAPFGQFFVLRGLPVDANIFSVKQFEQMDVYFPHQFYHEEKDYIPIFGDPSKVPLHTLNEERMEHEARSFDDVLLHPDYEDYRPKRLVTFFVLARQLGIIISDELIERAHNEELDPKDYLWLYNRLFTKSSPKVHH